MSASRLHADEIAFDDDVVRALLDAQCPQWADRPLRRMSSTGTDNAIYRLGDDLGVRVPRIGWALSQIEREHEWLPRVAPQLPVSVAEPVLKGAPGDRYPFSWLVYRWLEGEDALVAAVDDWCDLARDIAAFVAALHRIDTSGAPPSGPRGGPLAPHDASTRRAIEVLAGEIDAERALQVWEDALAADAWPGPPVWVHGDLLPGNIVVRDGRVSGVIDWSAAGVGDPACDVMLAWSLPPAARAVYRSALEIDDATWTRARGWSLQQAVLFIPYYAETIPTGVEVARRRLDAVLADGDA